MTKPAQPVYDLRSPEVQKLLELWGFNWTWNPSAEYIVRPDHRQYYALTPSTIERWTQHLRNCVSSNEIVQNSNPPMGPLNRGWGEDV